ncbi:branched-chain amino acid ABC transporter permease [Nocardioides bruguierae]|uniref:branched-chain amino acid ABC transporter permease n=1 Tax=Nocardioides bruguierae TaxID=2945102 RepID=UPI0020204FC3|nr:branched-chain amino acid ABC transporter permease [Nocardioides bruguierae]MCL8027549.1 carboxypeptidase regulatory-like domain-containing protein [Nocardioides bruguierae]
MSTTPTWARPRARGVTGLMALLSLLAGLLLLAAPGASASTTSTFCLPQADVSGCISGTVGNRTNPIEGADVTLLDSNEAEVDSVTTGADGKFSFSVDTAGTYYVAVDPESLPEDQEIIPAAERFQGPDGSLLVEVTLGQTTVPALEVRSVDYEAGGAGFGTQIVQSLAQGLRLGLLLALASIGLSLIYGTTGLSNFAHAEQVTLGGMLGYLFCNVLGLNLWIGIVVVTAVCAGSGYLQDRVLWQPLRRRGLGLTQLMIVTIGLSLAAQYTFQFFVGASTQKVVVESFSGFTLGPISLTWMSVIAMIISLVVIGIVGYVLLFTRVGQATRAVSDNPALAAASGIDVDKIIRGVWTAAAGLAGLGGVLYALVVSNGIRWDTGMQILLLLFAAVTLGGLGTAFGAFIGAIIIGLVVELAGPLGAPGDLKYAVALIILILLLLVRPQGLLGRASRVG